MRTIYVVTEAYGATATADSFVTWEAALAHARDRFRNFRSSDCETDWRTADATKAIEHDRTKGE